MQNSENMPISPTKRLGVPLNVDTTYKGKGNEGSPPHTPTARTSKGNNATLNRAPNIRNGPPRETFLDDITPIDPSNRDNETQKGLGFRDSHDLSLSPRQITRDSLVDNLLLSLDQFSYGPDGDGFGAIRQPTVEEESSYSSFDNEESYQPAQNQNFMSRDGRAAGHNYSYGSDYDNGDGSSQYSSQLSRGRRSNSSSNFQSVLGRINSIRNEAGSGLGFSGSRGQIPHSRSFKGSKGSSVNSLDLGYVQATSNQRWTHGLAGRSSSMEFGTEHQAPNPQSNMMPRSTNTNGAAFAPYDYDAAPTPTVPGGPRRPLPVSPIIIPHHEPIHAEPAPQKLERKRSTRSSKSAYKNKSSVSSGGRLDYGLHDQNRELPPLPAFIKDPASGPLAGYSKAKEPLPGPAQLSSQKQGFFRRVFGSKNHSAIVPEQLRSHSSTASADTGDRPNSKTQHIASQIKSQPPPREPPPPPKEPNHILTKKPSSFFRRRKRSASDAGSQVPMPIVPPIILQPKKEAAVAKPLPSPVSSLRQVMNPYIRTPQRSPIDLFTHDSIDRHMNNSPEQNERTMRGFSPDYEPDKNATIRAIKPNSRDHIEIIASSYTTAQKPVVSAGMLSKEEPDTTFLQDSSDDPDTHSISSKSAPPVIDVPQTTWLGTVKPSSQFVARDNLPVTGYDSNCSPKSPKFDTPKALPGNDAPSSPTESKSSSTRNDATAKARNDEPFILAPNKPPTNLGVENQGLLERSSSEEDLAPSNLALQPKVAETSTHTSGSADSVYKSATSLPIVQIEGEEEDDDDDENEPPARRLMTAAEAIKSLDDLAPAADYKTPVAGDRGKAQKIYDGNEDFIQKEKAAAWMGEEGLSRSRTLIAYMELYDFANLNILAALRIMCSRLVLKGESQQVDRILDAFAKRWCQCNPDHGFKVTDVVHTICYSILLLNTDLHLADIDQKMTRSQFIKNTMPTVRRSVTESAPDAFEPARATILPGKSQTFESAKSDCSLKPEHSSIEVERPSWRSSFKPPPRQDASGKSGVSPTPLDYDTPVDDCGPLVKAPFHGTLRTWEVQVEIVLKDFYNSIRNDRLPLFGAPIEKPHGQVSSNSLAVFANGMLRRTPSVLSKAPSDTQSYARGRTADSVRAGNGKWGNKNRSRPRLYPNSGFGSSRTSLDDQSSMWSPSVSSSTWSRYSLGKTHTSMSVDSLGSSFPQGDYQQSIGFANALSQAIIREEHIGSAGSDGSDHEELRVAPLLDDESLELAGAPWAKEGILKHKHHLEALEKKAKDRNWTEVFAVIEKGYMSLFSFSTKSMRNKSKGKASGGVVGGGNWQDNAESLGSFLLRQTIASALPSPGYSKSRPHVWALSLPSGAVHLFQVGTPDIVKEFVSTANYWSARLSNHPLVGGISNIEYGWSENIVNNALVSAINESAAPKRSTSGARPSLQSSLKSSLDQGVGNTMKSRLPGDKITISEWTPPTQSMRASNLLEPDQLRTLLAYVAGIEDELQRHNQLRSPMLLAFTPRHPNSQKAMANWERKSSYLLREIVKFKTYIDCLQAAEIGKQKIYAEREAQRSVAEDEDEGDSTLRPE